MRNCLRSAETVATPALAGPSPSWFWEGVRAAYARQDYQTAIFYLLPLAEHRNGDAQKSLGFIYENGQGVPQDYVQAVKWYRMAAEQGDAQAQAYLGYMYRNAKGVPRDYVQAEKWLRMGQSRAMPWLNLPLVKCCFATARTFHPPCQ